MAALTFIDTTRRPGTWSNPAGQHYTALLNHGRVKRRYEYRTRPAFEITPAGQGRPTGRMVSGEVWHWYLPAGAVVPPFTDGFVGDAPDIGAYEHGAPRWVAGCTHDPGC